MPADSRRDRPAAEHGTSLVELVVAMALLAVVLAATLAAALAVQRSADRAVTRNSLDARARVAVQHIDRQVRSGNVLYDPAAETPAGFLLRVYTQANGSPRCIQWRVDAAGRLQTRSWPPGATGTPWRTLVEGVANTATERPFSFAADGAYGHRLLNVDLKLASQSASDADATVTTSVAGRNTSYGFDAAICTPGPPA